MDLVAIAKALRELGNEPLVEARLPVLEAHAIDGASVEHRAGVFAVRVPIHLPFAGARDALIAELGRPYLFGDTWSAYRPWQAILLLADVDGTHLFLEPYGRTKHFSGIAPDVRTWLEARRAATSQTDAQREERKATRRALPRGEGRLVDPPKTRALASLLRELPFTRDDAQAFAATHGWILDDDHAFGGLRYLVPDIAAIQLGVNGELAMVVLAQSDNTPLDEHYAATLEELIPVLGEPIAAKTYKTVEKTDYALFRFAGTLALLTNGMDPRGDGGRAVALRLIAWPGEAPPAIKGDPDDWINGLIRERR